LSPALLNAMRAEPPDAVVIDLGRLPSQGRDLALGLRKHTATRHVPLVFVGGVPEKVTRVRELLPDAVYTTWEGIGEALEQAVTHPPADPVVPESTMAAYAGAPLPKKLGIKEGSSVALIDAPEGFETALGEVLERVSLLREASSSSDPDLTLWFVRSRQELEQNIQQMGAYAEKDGLWIIWPKKASGVVSDLSQAVVRKVGLASGLVDYKICSVDATWSGLRFAQRKS
jgi:hypothetical protein